MLLPDKMKQFDKATVLQMTIDFLRKYSGEGKSSKSFYLQCDEIGQLMTQILNGFVMVISEDAKFVYAADVIENILGMKPAALMGKTVHSVVHKDDQSKLLKEILSGCSNESRRSSAAFDSANKDTILLDFRICVEKEGLPTEYRPLSCIGKWHYFEKLGESEYESKQLVLLACLNTEELHEVVSTDTTMSFSSKHSLDGSFIFADHECSGITGYLPYELLGKSIYSFVHDNDISYLCDAHKEITKSSDAIQVFFRFRSKGNDWLLFKVECKMVANKTSHDQPDYISLNFISANTNEIHYFRQLAKFKERSIKNLLQQAREAAQSLKSDEDTNATDVTLNVERNEENIKLCKSPKRYASPSAAPSKQQTNKESNVKEAMITDDFIKVQQDLLSQLEEKHKTLNKAFEKQTDQLKRVASIMGEYAYFMEAPSFKSHYKQQLEMYDYFLYTLKKQQRQQQYLQKQLSGKVKELHIRQRAIKLREMASNQQRVLGKMKKVRDATRCNSTVKDPYHEVDTGHISTHNPVSICTTAAAVSNSSTFSGHFDVNFHNHTKTGGHTRKEFNKSRVFPYRFDNLFLNMNANQDVDRQEQQSPMSGLVSSIQTPYQQLPFQPPQSLTVSNQQQTETEFYYQLPPTERFVGPEEQQQQHQMARHFQTQDNKQLMQQIDVQNEFLSQNSNSLATTCNSPDLQSMLSNEILVKLQELQKHILNQLQSAIQSKKDSTDFSQILPVLQHLQELQQSMIEQETEQKQPKEIELQHQQPQDRHQEEHDLTRHASDHSISSGGCNIDVRTSDLVASMQSLKNCSRNVAEQNFPSDVPLQGSSAVGDSAFGDLDVRQDELKNIKMTFGYEHDTKYDAPPADCFPNVSSPDLHFLMFKDEEIDKQSPDENKDSNDLDKEKSLENNEEEETSCHPLLEDQQQLAQLQESQRMNILLQQQELFASSESDLQPLPFSPPTQPQPVSQSQEQQSNPNATATTSSVVNSTDYSFLHSLNESSLTDAVWNASENEEMINFVLSENDYFL
ncbi:circadian locomoter output cycles protein kaput-like isoform X2 [Hydractinia symbiolongicarpus]|nr:circadian locomoter output cycles protein kaput-like isoform X2 [Hydractinia symbiolongicarpus]XP_057313922.1 circadian locomoter output cycles protein kaput-like isoform X2 [Hydractinia symbiolongicarpus]XP_057313923.1 circadian locomoter output cycles protein kaput-like isoform X2 [Hydractinia symbiolongicarpus]